MSSETSLERLMRQDRLWVIAGIVGITALAWTYLVVMAAGMNEMSMSTPDMGATATAARMSPWTGIDFLLMFLMWAIMMVGMMLPSAAPMVLLFALVNRRQASRGHPATPTAVFTAGYLAAWTAFSLAATVAQWGLHRLGILSPMMVTTSALLGGGALAAAGVYQWSPLKNRCLSHCQSPLQFITTHWRDGTRGAFRMGWHHGVYCLGCCWFLMCLLFVGGVMNLLWIAGLALFVLVEKLWPHPWVPRLSGVVLVAWGALVLVERL